MPLIPLWRKEWAPRFPHGLCLRAIAFRVGTHRAGREKLRGGRARDANVKGLDTWQSREIFGSFKGEHIVEAVVDTRRVLTWETLDGKKLVKARLVAKGKHDPDLKEGAADAAGRVSLRSSHLHAISLGATKKRKI